MKATVSSADSVDAFSRFEGLIIMHPFSRNLSGFID